MVKITINGRELSVQEGTKILDAAQEAGYPIPHLCYLKGVNEIAACRMCVVEVEGESRLVPACDTVAEEGMVIQTNTPRVRQARRTNMKLLLSQHDATCAQCIRSGNCELSSLARELNVNMTPYPNQPEPSRADPSVPIVRNASKCIKCMRCVQVCDKIQAVHVWDVAKTGSRTTVDVAFGGNVKDTDCTFCGQCVTHCPTGALTARDDTEKVWKALADPEITTVIQVAPAVRSAWAESLGLSPEQATTGRMVAALKQLGFDYVFDTNFSADLTIMEEGSELIERIKHHDEHPWPMFTSCCPGWVRFLKGQFPKYTDNLSTAKSPQEMFGAVAKSWFAQRIGVDPGKMCVISVMPCSAKKAECALPTMKADNGDPEVDISLTTREMVRMFKSDRIVLENLKEEEFDSPLGTGTGAAVIFGATGGVLDAALRSAYFLITGENPDADTFKAIRGTQPWREATYHVPGVGDLRVAAVSGLANTRALMERIDSGAVQYDFVEVMACPGGCAGGGGQPIHEGQELAAERGDILWGIDAAMDVRYSHENPDVMALYTEEYLGKPMSEKAHHLLHTDHHGWTAVTRA